MKSLIFYYFRAGRTKEVAEFIKEELKSDIEEIVSLKERNRFFGIFLSIFESLFKRLTPIKEIEKDIIDYDLVLVGTIILAGNLFSPIRTFSIKHIDPLKNKDIIPVYEKDIKNVKFKNKIINILKIYK